MEMYIMTIRRLDHMLDTLAILILLFIVISPPVIYMLDRLGFESVDTNRR